jgi:hypothetical protein
LAGFDRSAMVPRQPGQVCQGPSHQRSLRVIAKRLGELLRVTQMLQDRRELSESDERTSGLEPDVDGALTMDAVLGAMREGCHRLLEPRQCLPVGRASGGLRSGLVTVRDGLLPYLSLQSMMGQTLDLFDDPVRMERFDSPDDSGMKSAAALLQEAPIDDFVSQRMLEGAFEVGKETRLIEELRLLQVCEPSPQRLLRLLRDRRQERVGHMLADDRGRLQELLSLRRQPVDPRRQDRLHRGRRL